MNAAPFSGDAWEDYCMELLSIRHGERLQRIPAARHGDLGLEAFTVDGLVYQCYGPVEPLPPQQRYEKHRDKLTVEIAKLVRNAGPLAAILGDVVIDSYVFLLPTWDDRTLLDHAEEKAAEVRGAGLAIVAPGFRIAVMTDEDFPEERARLVQVGLRAIDIHVEPVDLATVAGWAGLHASLIDTMNAKLSKLQVEQETQQILESEFLGHYLGSEDMLDRLRQDFPRIWHELTRVKREREVLLASQSALSTQEGVARLSEVEQTFREQIRESCPQFSREQAERIALGSIADWLLRCPLDFPGGSPA